MAQYKVPQDVEADDKFLGPLSFKQFIFGGLTAICGYVTFLLLSRGLAVLSPLFFLPMIVFAFLAFPWSKEQPTELWLAARIRFLIKPRRRIWDQSGMKELVTITVPKREAHLYTDGLSQSEVKSRMSALATMVDSRGWAVKNYVQNQVEPSDRLVAGNVTEHSPVFLPEPTEDVMDEDSGLIAQQFESKIQESEKKLKSEARHLIEEARQESQQYNGGNSDKSQKNAKNEEFWFMHQNQNPTAPGFSTFSASPVIKPGQSKSQSNDKDNKVDDKPLDEAALLEKVHEKQRRDALQTSHVKRLDPFKNNQDKHETSKSKAVTTERNPDTMKYVYNNDLSVETIQRQGHKKDDDDEVVISLH